MGSGVVIGGGNNKGELSQARRELAMAKVRSVLAHAAPEAVTFQREILNDPEADPKLRLAASEAILDRFMGKAKQEVEVDVKRERPILFDPKLQELRAAFKAAEDAQVRGESPEKAFMLEATRTSVDTDGIQIVE